MKINSKLQNKVLFLLFFFPLFIFSQTQVGYDIDGVVAGDNAGFSVSISTNGLIVAIGSPNNDSDKTGEVRIFENNSGSWIQLGNVINGMNIGDRFGSSVSLSSDGSIIVIGAPDAETAGYVQVYENIDDEWTQLGNDMVGQPEFIDGDGFLTMFSFGRSVSISDDGTILAIAEDRGPWVWEAGYGNDGYLHLYENNAGTWTLIDAYINTEISYLNDVSLSGDGSVVAISGKADHPPTDWVAPYGTVKVYKIISGSWTQLGSTFWGEGFAFFDTISHVSLTTNGSKIAIGGTFCKVYEYMDSEWVHQVEGIEGENIYNKVSLSDNGSILAYNTDYGLTRIYNYNSGTWLQLGDDIIEEAPDDNFGASLELSGDGTTLIVGAPNNDGNGTDAGHARVYDLSALLSSDEFVLTQFGLYPNPASNQIEIKLNQNLELQGVNIYNNLGQFIKSKETNIVRTSDLASGLYYVEVITNQGKATKKLILK